MTIEEASIKLDFRPDIDLVSVVRRFVSDLLAVHDPRRSNHHRGRDAGPGAGGGAVSGLDLDAINGGAFQANASHEGAGITVRFSGTADLNAREQLENLLLRCFAVDLVSIET